MATQSSQNRQHNRYMHKSSQIFAAYSPHRCGLRTCAWLNLPTFRKVNSIQSSLSHHFLVSKNPAFAWRSQRVYLDVAFVVSSEIETSLKLVSAICYMTFLHLTFSPRRYQVANGGDVLCQPWSPTCSIVPTKLSPITTPPPPPPDGRLLILSLCPHYITDIHSLCPLLHLYHWHTLALSSVHLFNYSAQSCPSRCG